MKPSKKFLVFPILFALLTSNAFALMSKSIFPSRILGWLQYFLVDLPKNYAVPPFIIYAKLLMWILVFALLDMAAKRINGMPKKTGSIVALILSLMSVLLMPEGIIAYVFKSYSLVISVVLLLVPSGIGIFVNMALKGDKPSMKVIKAFLWIFIGVMTISVANVIHSYPV